jgi:hypothetical protein
MSLIDKEQKDKKDDIVDYEAIVNENRKSATWQILTLIVIVLLFASFGIYKLVDLVKYLDSKGEYLEVIVDEVFNEEGSTSKSNVNKVERKPDWKNYRNDRYSYGFEYPRNYDLNGQQNYFHLYRSDNNVLRHIFYGTTSEVGGDDSGPIIDHLVEQAELFCPVSQGDGPLVTCLGLNRVRTFTNSKGTVVYEMYLNTTERNLKNDVELEVTDGPIYAIELPEGMPSRAFLIRVARFVEPTQDFKNELFNIADSLIVY